MNRIVAVLLPFCAALAATAAPAWAAERIFSYDPANAATRVLAAGGFTFVFEERLFRDLRVTKLLSSHDQAEARLKPASEADLGAGLDALAGRRVEARDLYEIGDEENGPALIRAACPGAVRAFLAFGELERHRPLAVEVFGRDEAGKPRHCTTLEFSYRGEWRLPDDPARLRARLPAYDPRDQ